MLPWALVRRKRQLPRRPSKIKARSHKPPRSGGKLVRQRPKLVISRLVNVRPIIRGNKVSLNWLSVEPRRVNGWRNTSIRFQWSDYAHDFWFTDRLCFMLWIYLELSMKKRWTAQWKKRSWSAPDASADKSLGTESLGEVNSFASSPLIIPLCRAIRAICWRA